MSKWFGLLIACLFLAGCTPFMPQAMVDAKIKAQDDAFMHNCAAADFTVRQCKFLLLIEHHQFEAETSQ